MGKPLVVSPIVRFAHERQDARFFRVGVGIDVIRVGRCGRPLDSLVPRPCSDVLSKVLPEDDLVTPGVVLSRAKMETDGLLPARPGHDDPVRVVPVWAEAIVVEGVASGGHRLGVLEDRNGVERRL